MGRDGARPFNLFFRQDEGLADFAQRDLLVRLSPNEHLIQPERSRNTEQQQRQSGGRVGNRRSSFPNFKLEHSSI